VLWMNQFLVFGPLLCIHAQYVCEKRADPLTPCLPDLHPTETKSSKDNLEDCSVEQISFNLHKTSNHSVDVKPKDPTAFKPDQNNNALEN